MRPSLRASVRHARPLLALLAGAGVACSDQADLTGVRATAPASDVAPSAAPAASVDAEFGTAASAVSATLTGGTGSYNLRTGPGTNYNKLGTATAGTAVQVVCTSVTRSTTGSTTRWARIRGDEFNTWVSGIFVRYASGSSTPPDCDASAGPQIAAGLRGDDYPLRTADPDPGCPTDGNGFCIRQCTSFVTWRLRDVNGIKFWGMHGGLGWGSAYKWRDAARALGYRVDRTPEVGAVAYFAKTASRTSGHVAWVASVSSDKQRVTIEEYNVHTRRGYGTRTMSVSSIDNFIHVY